MSAEPTNHCAVCSHSGPSCSECIADAMAGRGLSGFTSPTPRAAIEATIHRLIDMLDDIDGDPDFEPVDEREPEEGI